MSTLPLPAEYENRMVRLLGDEYAAYAVSLTDPPLRALRINPLKRIQNAAGEMADPSALFPQTDFAPVPWCPEGFCFPDSDTFHPGRSPYHAAGAYYIQEPSAMAASVCLDAQPGEIILDLCAAPGGKSTQIASAMRGEGLLIANEIIPSRAKALSENIERMGIRNAVVTCESPQSLSQRWPAFFDRILVDAPCSGEGMFRKNPDAAGEWSPEASAHCAKRQDEILFHAARMLSPGGVLVYSTCTFSPMENEGSLLRFLHSHPDFHLAPPPFSDAQREAFGFAPGRCDLYPDTPDEIRRAIRIYPHRAKGEGHFIAVLHRDGRRRPPAPEENAGESRRKRGSAAHRTFSLSPQDLARAFLQEMCPASRSVLTGQHAVTRDTDRILPPARLISFGDQVYLLPDQAPDLSGIRVLRAGLHLGTVKKNRFEPSHALALALSPEDASRTMDLTQEQAAAWIGGQTLPVPEGTPAGWTLITLRGISLGWGKCAGGMMKNHYPKGLRRMS